jgi:aryl-alcohol dehydrogenase-like predicted oxidoreductase
VRDYEHELQPLGVDQQVGAVVWSGLGGSALTGKVRRGQELPSNSRLSQPAAGGLVAEAEHIYGIVDVLDELVAETGHSISQIALNWLLQRPTVASIVVGARTEEQLRDNLGAVGWSLDPHQVARLDAASEPTVPYPYNHQQEKPFFLPAPWTTT